MSDLIGFFDSGLGGISVLHEARRVMPNENYLFFGDNKNTPYGPRSLEEIRALSEAGIGRLLDRGVKAVVIACNTVTSAYGEIVRAEHPELPIIGMEPALKPAHFARHGGKVIVLATDAT
ncbi:MAG: aspartate/glutamate racemase family protein, partial [Clostridia bacterium]|nr:aspartate/glutamate racemase family protein [Clostridia bacterium]